MVFENLNTRVSILCSVNLEFLFRMEKQISTNPMVFSSKVQSSIDDIRVSYEGTGTGDGHVRVGLRVGGEAAQSSSSGPCFGNDRRNSKTDGLSVNAWSSSTGARKDDTPCTSEVSTPSLSDDMPPRARHRRRPPPHCLSPLATPPPLARILVLLRRGVEPLGLRAGATVGG